MPEGEILFPINVCLSGTLARGGGCFNTTNQAPQRATSTNLTPTVCISLQFLQVQTHIAGT